MEQDLGSSKPLRQGDMGADGHACRGGWVWNHVLGVGLGNGRRVTGRKCEEDQDQASWEGAISHGGLRKEGGERGPGGVEKPPAPAKRTPGSGGFPCPASFRGETLCEGHPAVLPLGSPRSRGGGNVFALKLLGKGQIEGPDGPHRGRAAHRQRMALLSLLALSGTRGQSRDRLIALLWPESDTQRTRHLLSDAVYLIRKEVGEDAVLSVGDDLILNHERMRSDVSDFERALADGDPARAVELYAGPFLEGFHLGDAPEYGRWLDGERRRLGLRYGTALETLAIERRDAGDVLAAVEWWRRLAAHEPYDGRIALEFMRALDAAGNRAGAIQHAAVYAELLGAEVGVDPDPEILRLVQSLRESAEPPARPSNPLGPDTPDLPAVPRVVRRGSSEEDVVTALEGEGRVESGRTPPGAAVARTLVSRSRGPVARVVTLVVVSLAIGATVRVAMPGGTSPAPGKPVGEPQRILVADFPSFTSDPLLGDAVSQALRVDLARSPGLRVVGSAGIAGALSRMRRDPDAPLRFQLAHELAQREGIPAVIDGEVRETGAGYVISATVVEAATGEVIGGWRETATDSSGVLVAIDRLSREIRAGLGASLASAMQGEEFVPGTTASLDALRAYSHGNRSFFAGDLAQAAALYQEAVRLDPAFALAHWMVALTLPAAGRGRARGAYVRAYEHRHGLPANERFGVEGMYHRAVRGDLAAAIEAFRRQVHAAKPMGDVVMYGSLSEALADAGDLQGAEAVLWEAREVYPHAQNQAALVSYLHHQGKLEAAKSALEYAELLFPGNPVLLRTRVWVAAASNDLARADSLAGHLPSALRVGEARRLRAQIAALEGRIREALELLASVERELVLAGDAGGALEVTADMGRLRLVQGRRDVAVAGVEASLSRQPLDSLDPEDRPYLYLARFFAEAGEPERGREFLAAYEREVPDLFRGADRQKYLRARAAVRLAGGDGDSALADLELAGRHPPPFQAPLPDRLIPIHDRPELARAYEGAGRPEAALAVLERFLAHPTLGRMELDAYELPASLLRLAEHHEARNDPPAAARYYLRFAELWREADPELQPRVAEARRRALAGPGG